MASQDFAILRKRCLGIGQALHPSISQPQYFCHHIVVISKGEGWGDLGRSWGVWPEQKTWCMGGLLAGSR